MSKLQVPVAEVFKPLLKPARYKGAHGGRSSGKSVFFADLALVRGIQRKTDILACREFQKSMRESVHKLLESRIQALGLESHYTVQQDRILSAKGGRIVFVGLHDTTAHSIKSYADFDVAWVEEAQTLSQRSLDILRPTIRKDGSELWFSWNPSAATDPVDILLRSDDRPSDSIVVQANYTDNPWSPAVMIEEAAYDQKRDPSKFAHVWLGGYQQRKDALIFKNWRVDSFESDPYAEYLYGIDFGFAKDPSAGVRSYIKGRNLFVDYEVHGFGVETIDLPSFFLRLPGIERWTSVADSARPESISHLRNNGLPKIMGAVKGPGSVEDGIDYLRSFDIVVHPRCIHMIDELTHYSYKVSKQTELVLPEVEEGNDHCIDALRYGTEPARRISAVASPNSGVVHDLIQQASGRKW